VNQKSNNPPDRSKPLNLVYIIGTYPSLTTTFIDRELNTLRSRVNVNVISIRRPAGTLSDNQKQIQQETRYLLPPNWIDLIGGHLWFIATQPIVYFATCFYLLTRHHPNFRARFKTLFHFVTGVYAAYLMRRSACNHVHAHFIDRAATVALVAGRLLGIPYSLTAHANDIYVNPILLAEKLTGASFIATCTAYNHQHLSRLDPVNFNGKLHCIYHGLDMAIYRPQLAQRPGKPLLTAVGQLREKKGFTFLLAACRSLKDRGYDFDCQIIGEGPLRSVLEDQIRQLSLEKTVSLCGALPHQQVIEAYQRSTIFVLPCITGGDGDRDGIPNVILEALAMELPVVSTHHTGIPEVVTDGVNGRLVPPGDAAALADALAQLLDNPDLRVLFGQNGRQTVREKFDLDQNTQRLLAQFIKERPLSENDHKSKPICQI
jgi:colanic acid/amylovoran biosynthesis glycosyltransferase